MKVSLKVKVVAAGVVVVLGTGGGVVWYATRPIAKELSPPSRNTINNSSADGARAALQGVGQNHGESATKTHPSPTEGAARFRERIALEGPADAHEIGFNPEAGALPTETNGLSAEASEAMDPQEQEMFTAVRELGDHIRELSAQRGSYTPEIAQIRKRQFEIMEIGEKGGLTREEADALEEEAHMLMHRSQDIAARIRPIQAEMERLEGEFQQKYGAWFRNRVTLSRQVPGEPSCIPQSERLRDFSECPESVTLISLENEPSQIWYLVPGSMASLQSKCQAIALLGHRGYE